VRTDLEARHRTGVALAIALAAVGFVLYWFDAGRPFGYDEAETVGNFVRQGSFVRPFTHQIVFNNHPLFSFALVLMRKVGGFGEAWMRLLPALLGAATVGLFTGWAYRRYGWRAAVGGALVLGTCPLFVSQVRQARGYALIVFCALVASIVLVDDLRTRGWRVVYVAAIAIAVGTHLYALLVVAGHLGFVLARRRAREDRVADLVSLALGVGLGALVYVGLWDTMARVASQHRGVSHPEFPSQVLHGLLGRSFVAIAIVAVLLVVAASDLLRRPELLAAVAFPVAALLWIWKVDRPVELYPRFMIAAALPIAAAIAWVIHRHPPLFPVAIVAAVALLVPQLPRLDHEPPLKAVARDVDATRALGLEPCAFSPWPLGAYTALPRQARSVRAAAGCDVIVQVGAFGRSLVPALRARYPYEWRNGDLAVLSRVPRERLRAAGQRE
jgi:mannosyltransferase